MNGLKRGWLLVSVALAMLGGCSVAATAQVPTTTVSDTVYRADGTPAGGTVLISWAAFTTAGGSSIPSGNTSVTIGSGGLLTVALVPNAGSTPVANFYTAVYHLNDGSTSREYWVVPASVPGGGPAKLAAIRNQVLPTSVAMQTVSKQYVDAAIAAASSGFPLDTSPYVLKAGDTMTGPLVLPADPVSANQAADKNYVDENVSAIATGLSGKVALLPSATQIVAQPTGTQLDVNLLNGDLNASQYQTGSGNNGITNALASADCASGCKVNAEATYPEVEGVNVTLLPQMSQVVDARGGSEVHTAFDPLGVSTNANVGLLVNETETLSTAQMNALRPGLVTVTGRTMSLTMQASAGGSNQFPEAVETPVFGKNTYGVLELVGNYNTQGQHVQSGNEIHCYAVGDCLAGSQFITSAGGYRDSADEGAHPFDLFVTEDTHVFTGVCNTGCTTGSTQITVGSQVSAGSEGDGRFLIDKNPAKVFTAGTLVGGGLTIFGTASFTGTSFAASVFLSTASAATSQPTALAPGTVTLPIQTSGVTPGFATTTAALPTTSGVACVADAGSALPSYEMANYTVVDATHVQLTLNKVHALGATIAVGGLCGYGLEQTVDTASGIRQVFPVVGSINATSLYYAEATTSVVGMVGTTSGYLNESLTVATIARSGNVTTVTTAGNLPVDVNGLTLTVSGVADSSYNGSYVVTTTGANTLTYPNTGSDSTSSGGNLSVVTGGFALYPMAEVLSVYNPSTKVIDGLLTLATNTVPWATGDAVEQPHYYQQQTYADTEQITQFVPRPVAQVSAGKVYFGEMGPGARGWQIENGVVASDYLGAGGTHAAPDAGFVLKGVWNSDLDVDAGVTSVMTVHCNLHTCNRWNSGYSLFELDSTFGEDQLNFLPQSHTMQWNLFGTVYSMAPSGFTAGTINVGTLNATTITGGISGSSITSGTISAARLPLFGPSGTTHAPGIVPDPGATAGATRFLREDGTWNVPAGGSGGSPTGAAGGDLSGNYPSPTVSAVHATSGSLDGVTVGATTPASVNGTNYSIAGNLFLGSSSQAVTGNGNIVIAKFAENYNNYGVGCWVSYPDPAGTGTIQQTYLQLTGFANSVASLSQPVNMSLSPNTPILGKPFITADTYISPGTATFVYLSLPIQNYVSGSGEVIKATCYGDGTVPVTVLPGGSAGANAVATTYYNGTDVNGRFSTDALHETLFTPASSSASCSAGDMADDANYHYVCVAANTWKRVGLSTF